MLLVAAITTFGIALGSGSAALASDATLRVTLHTSSQRIAADARAVSRDARQRHPRLMTASAIRFSRDALHARAAIARQRPSGANGLRAKRLALRAFSSYALAGHRWAASGRARVRGQRTAATALAASAARYARDGNRLLLAAGSLLG